jgi:hypothetical protein
MGCQEPLFRLIGYDYSGLNQRTAENWVADTATSSTSTNTISNTYYGGGELHTTVAAAAGGGDSSKNSKYTFGYNALGQVTSVDNNGGSTSGTAGVPDVVLNAQYDLNGNRTALTAQVDVVSGLEMSRVRQARFIHTSMPGSRNWASPRGIITASRDGSLTIRHRACRADPLRARLAALAASPTGQFRFEARLAFGTGVFWQPW